MNHKHREFTEGQNQKYLNKPKFKNKTFKRARKKKTHYKETKIRIKAYLLSETNQARRKRSDILKQ